MLHSGNQSHGVTLTQVEKDGPRDQLRHPDSAWPYLPSAALTSRLSDITWRNFPMRCCTLAISRTVFVTQMEKDEIHDQLRHPDSVWPWPCLPSAALISRLSDMSVENFSHAMVHSGNRSHGVPFAQVAKGRAS